MKKVLVVGGGGQDGRILFDALSDHAAILSIDREEVRTHHVAASEIPSATNVVDPKAAFAMCEAFKPDEVYYLAAHHHSSEERPDDAVLFRASYDIHVMGIVHVLDALRAHAPACRVFYAGSSHMFGRPLTSPQNEDTPFSPRNPYAITKVAGAHVCAMAREKHGMHVSVGILYNHESRHRGPTFVSQRIVQGARAIAAGRADRLKLGSLSAIVDWGHADDTIDAMTRILAQPTPGDYVIATGVPHSVKDFVEIAFGEVGLDWRTHVDEDANLVREAPPILIGDASRLRDRTGWKPRLDFRQMVVRLLSEAQ